VSFGRRLALFFFLIVVLPMLALIVMLVNVSADSREGKADARLAAGLETALAVYRERENDARRVALRLARTPALASAVVEGDAPRVRSLLRARVAGPRIAEVEVESPDGKQLAVAGDPNAIARARLALQDRGTDVGTLAVSTTTAEEFVQRTQSLTSSELVVRRGDEALASTIATPGSDPDPGETVDLAQTEERFRGRLTSLDEAAGEELVVLGEVEGEGLLAIDAPVIAALVAFFGIAMAFAYVLARALTGLHGRVAQEAVTDPLTGLSNRRRMWELLGVEVDRAGRYGRQLSLAVVDVDGFKLINDRYGHPRGDAVMRALTEIVKSETRTIDQAARYGGDEIVLVLPETGAEGAMGLAQRLRRRVAERPLPWGEDGPAEVTVSVGLATMPDSAMDAEALLDAADTALLEAKRAGKDRVRSAPRSRRGGGGAVSSGGERGRDGIEGRNRHAARG
jgi:diguanylate cyclase (GGDEF)-like protein